MARILAVDWDTQEVRFVLAATSGSTLKVEAAGSAPLIVTGGEKKPSKPDVGQSLQNALAGVKLGRVTVVVGVDRASVEMLHLTLPPAKDSELPELVLNQAMRESQNVAEDSALDFLTVAANPAEPRKVTAAALSAEQVQQIMAVCATARLKPVRLVLRPYAAAALFAQTAPPEQRVCLLINLIGDEADLTLMVDKQVAFLRTVRLPGAAEEEKRTPRLLAEIQRTLAVALVGELEKEGVQGICVFGAPGDHQALIERMGADLGLTATLLNPFDAAPTPAEFQLENPGRFAALLGMAIEEKSGRAPAIDFLRPRRRARPRSRHRNLVVAAAAVLVVAAVGGLMFWDKVSAATADNQQLDAELHNLKGLLEKAGEQKRLVEAIHDWQSSDITWLDELRDLSIRFPSARDMVVLRMIVAAAHGGGGDVEIQGMVRDPSIVYRMEENVRDKFHHEVRSKREQERVHEKIYTWHFETSMSVNRRDKTQYVSHLPDQGAAASKAPAAGTDSTNSTLPPAAATETPAAGTGSASGTPQPAEASSVHDTTENAILRRTHREQVP